VAAIAVSAGIGAWSFTEYVIHRWFMHEERGPAIASRGHLDHHRQPTKRPLASPLSLMMTFVIGLLVLCPVGAWLATLVGAPWFVGTLVGLSGIATYLVYERVHFQAHFRPARTRYTRWQQRRHLHHHARGGAANFGVTSPVWDVVFGTYERVAVDEPVPPHLTAF
jgi:dihydroceramide fatty acyl 2-hydroxylase